MPAKRLIQKVVIEGDLEYDDSIDAGVSPSGSVKSTKNKKRNSPKQILKDIITFRLRKKDVIRIYRNREKGLYDYIKDNFDEIKKQYKAIRIDLKITKNYVEIKRIKKKKIKAVPPDVLENLGSEKPVPRYERDIDIPLNIRVEKEIDTNIFSRKKELYNIKSENIKNTEIKVNDKIDIKVFQDKYLFTTFYIPKEDLHKVIANKDYLFKITKAKEKEIKAKLLKEPNIYTSKTFSIYSVVVSKSGRVHITFQSHPTREVDTEKNVSINILKTDRVILPNINVKKENIITAEYIKQLFKEISIKVNRAVELSKEYKSFVKNVSLKFTKAIQISRKGIENIGCNIRKITDMKAFLSTRTIKKLNIFLNISKDMSIKIFKEKEKPKPETSQLKQEEKKEKTVKTQPEEKGIIASLKKFLRKIFR